MSDKPSYWQLLQDPRWQKKRLEIFESEHWLCDGCRCGIDDGKQFHAHHKYYVKGRMPWDYPSFAYVALCDDCHQREHEQPILLARWEVLSEVLFRKPEFSIGWDHISESLDAMRGNRQSALICSISNFISANKEAFAEHVEKYHQMDEWEVRVSAKMQSELTRLGRALTPEEMRAVYEETK